jgi:hypothetical protein
MTGKTVTFETKCWERDWKLLLCTGRLRDMVERCNYPFAERILYVNNVRDNGRVMKAAQRLKNDGTITEVVFVEDLAQQALAGLGIDKESFRGGYYYSIQELVGIFHCKTDYLLHFSSDSIQTNSEPWIDQAVERMEANGALFAANPNWDETGRQAKEESVSEDDLFFFSSGFSDQCYLVRPDVFRRPIYNEEHPASMVYPRYGGELFEKRVNSYMRNHGCSRLTSKNTFCVHKNYPRDPFRRWIMYHTGINLKK